MRLKMHQGTTSTSKPSLCRSCRWGHTLRMATSNDETTWCKQLSYEHPQQIRGTVAECSNYDDKSQPTLSSMREIAWRVSSDKHRPIGFMSPKEWKQMAKEQGEERETFILPDGEVETHY